MGRICWRAAHQPPGKTGPASRWSQVAQDPLSHLVLQICKVGGASAPLHPRLVLSHSAACPPLWVRKKSSSCSAGEEKGPHGSGTGLITTRTSDHCSCTHIHHDLGKMPNLLVPLLCICKIDDNTSFFFLIFFGTIH